MHQDPVFDTSDTRAATGAGANMRTADALRLALEVAELALEVAERAGTAPRLVAVLRMQATRLRAEV